MFLQLEPDRRPVRPDDRVERVLVQRDRVQVERFAVMGLGELRVRLRFEREGELRCAETGSVHARGQYAGTPTTKIGQRFQVHAALSASCGLRLPFEVRLTFLSSSLTSSTESARMPPSPPVTDVPSIDGSGASPLSGARYSCKLSVGAPAAFEVAAEPDAESESDDDDPGDSGGDVGRLETGEASSAAKLMLAARFGGSVRRGRTKAAAAGRKTWGNFSPSPCPTGVYRHLLCNFAMSSL